MKTSSLGLRFAIMVALGALLRLSVATLLSYYQDTQTAFALSLIHSGFLAFYRPGLWDWSIANRTQTDTF